MQWENKRLRNKNSPQKMLKIAALLKVITAIIKIIVVIVIIKVRE